MNRADIHALALKVLSLQTFEQVAQSQNYEAY